MAYNQRPGYQQPPPQGYTGQPAPGGQWQQGQYGGGYDNQYDYGGDQYGIQPPNGGYGWEQQGQYDRGPQMNSYGQYRDQQSYSQQQYDQQYQNGYGGYQDQGYNGPPQGPPQGRSQQPPPQQGRPRLGQIETQKKPKRERILQEPVSPVDMPWDNPFPVFKPTKKKEEDKKKHSSLDKELGAININDSREQSRPHTSHGQRRPEDFGNGPRPPIGRRPSAGAAQGRGIPNQYKQAYGGDQRAGQGLSPGGFNGPLNGPPNGPPPGRPRGLSRSNTMPDVGGPYTGPLQQNWQQPGNAGQRFPPATRNFPDARPAMADGAGPLENPNIQRSGSDEPRLNKSQPFPTQGQPLAPARQQSTREMPNFDAIDDSRHNRDHMSPITGPSDKQQYQAYQKATYKPAAGQNPPSNPPTQGLPNPPKSSPPPDPAFGKFSFGLPSGPAPKRKPVDPASGAPAPVQIPSGGLNSNQYGLQVMSPEDSEGGQQYNQAGNNGIRGMDGRPDQRGPPDQSQYATGGQGDPRRPPPTGPSSQPYPPRTASRSANRPQNGPNPMGSGQQPYQPYDQGYTQNYPDQYNQGYSGYENGYGDPYGQGYYGQYNPQQSGPGMPPGPPQQYGPQQTYGQGQPPAPNMLPNMGITTSPIDPATGRPIDGQIGPIAGPGMAARPPPIRPGLNPENDTITIPNKPIPVRQNDPAPQASTQVQVPRASLDDNLPVTAYDLNLMQQAIRSNPEDHKIALTYAKKLVEAASVLANEGGKADAKTTQKNREKYIFDAHKQIKKLVNAGYAEAMFYLADCHGSGGLGLQVDPQEAFKLYQSAAKLGHAQAAYRVAVCCEMGHEEGGGTKRDPPRAFTWYKRAAAMGDTPAMYKSAMILLKGLLGQPPNRREAVTWLKRAAERANEENPHALHELGLLYESANGNDVVVRDVAHAKELFEQAARLGYKFSQYRLASAYEYGNLDCPIDPRQSIKWYSKAASQGEHQSELALSGWYLTGSEGILQQSDTEAYLWARKAAQSGLAKAEYAMGYFTEVGIGVTANLDEAKKWYWRAAAQNFPKARERLEALKKGGSKMQKTRVSRSNIDKQSDGECVVM